MPSLQLHLSTILNIGDNTNIKVLDMWESALVSIRYTYIVVSVGLGKHYTPVNLEKIYSLDRRQTCSV